jgi:hypothetical protein
MRGFSAALAGERSHLATRVLSGNQEKKMKSYLAFALVALALVRPAQAEPLPANSETVGEIVFNQPVRACWSANDCKTLPPYQTWVIYKLKDSQRPGSWGYSVCVYSVFTIGPGPGPTECAWVTPTPHQVESFGFDAPRKNTQDGRQQAQERFDESTKSIGNSFRRIARSLWAIITLSPRSDEDIARDNAADKYSAPSSYRPVPDEKNTPGDSGAGVRSTNHLPVTHEVVTQGQPRRDARRYAVFVWASGGIYANQCMLKNDPMRTRSLEKLAKYSSSFSDEERSQASKEALAEFNRLGSYEFCRINYRAMGRPAL